MSIFVGIAVGAVINVRTLRFAIRCRLGFSGGIYPEWPKYCTCVAHHLCYTADAMRLDVSSLEDALAQLEEGLHEVEVSPDSELLRDGVIQRFEYSHELAIKFIRRTLEIVYGDSVDPMAYNDVLRTAAERGLITNAQDWFAYRSARNKTAHTYDAAVAAEVFKYARPFLRDGCALLDRLHAILQSPT